MTPDRYDLLIIGGGAAGGTVASAVAAQGRSVLMIERDKLGGTCLNYGCDPTKTLLQLAGQIAEAKVAKAHGIDFGIPTVHWSQVQHHLRQIVNQMRGGSDDQARHSLKKEGIDTIKGEARFISQDEVAVGDTTYRARQILIVTGSIAVVPDIPGLQEAGFLTNREAIWLDTLPRRMAIIGGGPIGVEFSQMFTRFGVEVTLLEEGKQILSKDDAELTTQLRSLLVAENIRIETEIDHLRVQPSGDEKQIDFTSATGSKETITVDAILVATGFKPVIDELDLHAAGVEVEEGAIKVDQSLRTNVPHIWAAGDVLGKFQFTHVASAQGRLLARSMFAKKPEAFDERVIPWVTYTSPELAHVGKTEDELREAGINYTVGTQDVKSLERALIMGQTDGVVKLLVGKDGTILGGHILAPHAGEMIAPVIVAMRAGLKAHDLAEAIYPYPTLSDGVQNAAQAALDAQKK